jgi:NTE family protein
VSEPKAPLPGQVVLVLQGGGALGAYQAGVYEALHEAGMEPDWVIGISIGAINGAIITGNAPADRLRRLRELWHRVRNDSPLDGRNGSGLGHAFANWAAVVSGVPGMYAPRPLAWANLGTQVGVENASYYLTAPLRKTLEPLIDFRVVNAQDTTRLTVGAVNIKQGTMRYFDSRDGALGLDHVMASSALPPAFPAVPIDGEEYWDGGVYSNTPMEIVFDDDPRRNALIFDVNVWQPTGPEPGSIWQVMGRQKDIQYSTRAAPTATSSARSRSTSCATSSASSPGMPSRLKRSTCTCASSAFMAAIQRCTWRACSRRRSTARTSSRTSTSAPPASGRAGRRDLSTRGACSSARRGRRRRIRWRA